MREYSYQATNESIEAFRRLKAPWTAAAVTPRRVVITTADLDVIRLSVEQTDVEPALEASRIRADLVGADDANFDQGAPLAIDDLGRGRNDIVLFTGETWMEEPAAGARDGDGAGGSQTMQISGRAGQRPVSATVVCTTTDAIVAAASTGEGVLIRIGVKPLTLDVVRDRLAIARFLVQRGYATE